MNFKTCHFQRGTIASHDLFSPLRPECASKSPGSHVGEAPRACADPTDRGVALRGAGRTCGEMRRGVSLKTSHRSSQLVYPRMTPMLKREHPVPVILIAPLASPNCGGPLRSARNGAAKCASKTTPPPPANMVMKPVVIALLQLSAGLQRA